MVVREWGRLRALRCSQVVLLGIGTTSSHGGGANALTSLIGRVVKQSADVMNEQRVESLSDFLLIRKVQRAVKRDPAWARLVRSVLRRELRHLPDTLEVHWANLDHVASLLALQDAIAATTGHASDVEELRAIDHVIVLTSGDTDAIGLDLEAEAPFIFPQRSGHTGFHAMRRNLPGGVKGGLEALARRRRGWRRIGADGGQRQCRLRYHLTTHGRGDGMAGGDGGHGWTVGVAGIAGRGVVGCGGLQGLRLAIARIMGDAGARARGWGMRLAPIHVRLRGVHTVVALRVRDVGWVGVGVRCAGRWICNVLGGRCVQSAQLVTLHRRRIRGVGVVGVWRDRGVAEGARPRRRANRRGAWRVVNVLRIRGTLGVGVGVERRMGPVSVGSPGLNVGQRWQRQLYGGDGGRGEWFREVRLDAEVVVMAALGTIKRGEECVVDQWAGRGCRR